VPPYARRPNGQKMGTQVHHFDDIVDEYKNIRRMTFKTGLKFETIFETSDSEEYASS
jgi:hypothetical protein